MNKPSEKTNPELPDVPTCIKCEADKEIERLRTAANEFRNALLVVDEARNELVRETARLKELQIGLARYIKPYFEGDASVTAMSIDPDTILNDFVDEDVFESVFEPCALCNSPKNSYKHREDHFWKAKAGERV